MCMYMCVYIHIQGFDYVVTMVCSKKQEFKEPLVRPLLCFAAGLVLSLSAHNAVS